MCVHGYVTDWNLLTGRVGGIQTDEMCKANCAMGMYENGAFGFNCSLCTAYVVCK